MSISLLPLHTTQNKAMKKITSFQAVRKALEAGKQVIGDIVINLETEYRIEDLTIIDSSTYSRKNTERYLEYLCGGIKQSMIFSNFTNLRVIEND
jgi:hypothetical protein